MIKPLTLEEYARMRNEKFGSRLTLSYPAYYNFISQLFNSNFFNFPISDKALEIYDIGVGSGRGIISLSRRLGEFEIKHRIHAVDKREEQLIYSLGLNFKESDYSRLELHLGDITKRKLRTLADLTICINMVGGHSNERNGCNSDDFAHILFDNLVNGTKVGGFILTDALNFSEIDEKSYGISKAHFETKMYFENIWICNRIKAFKKHYKKRVFQFPVRYPKRIIL